MLAKIKNALLKVLPYIAALWRNLSAAQRKTVYKVAAALLVALAVKLGFDSEWVESVVAFIVAAAPALAHAHTK